MRGYNWFYESIKEDNVKMPNKSKKIVLILFYKHFENKDIDMFDIGEMRRQGFEVEIWVLVKLSYSFNIKKPLHCYEGREVTEFRIFSQVEERIRKMDMKSSFFILYPGEAYDNVSNSVRRSIVKHRGKYANYYYSMQLNVGYNFEERSSSFFDITKEYFSDWKNNQYKLYSDIKIFINTFFYPSKYEILRGKAGYSQIKNKFLQLSKKCIVLHSEEVDTYIRNKKKRVNNEMAGKRYAVFVDQYLEGHSDFIKGGVKSPILSRERYYTELNNFFDIVERVYNCEVIIAEHPKAEYMDNPFQGRKMIINQTQMLIKNAVICIFHYSTCYSFILLLKKPYFQIITTDLKQNSSINMHIMEFEKQGFSKVCDISSVNEERIKDYLNVYNADIHDKYMNYFLGYRDSSNMLSMSIICQLIKEKLEKK